MNAAAVAPEIKKLVNVFAAVLKTNSCCTGEKVSETMTCFPSGETAKTFPVTRGVVLTVGGLADAAIAISPFCVPMNAVEPPEANWMEFGISPGLALSRTGVAAVGGEPPMGTRKASQCALVAHVAADFVAELAANTVNGVEVVPVNVPLTGSGG